MDVANGNAVKELLRKVRAPGPNPYFWLQTQLVSTPESTIAKTNSEHCVVLCPSSSCPTQESAPPPTDLNLVGTHAYASCSLLRNPVTWALSHQECLNPAASAPTGLKTHLVSIEHSEVRRVSLRNPPPRTAPFVGQQSTRT